MPVKTDKYLLSEGDSLRKIKYTQIRKQIPALILIAIALALNAIFPGNNLYAWALALALAGIAWYLFIGLCHRYKQRIPLPPERGLLSPIQGRISSIRRSEDITTLNIRKILLDSVEIRCPHDTCRLEDENLYQESDSGRISYRFSFRNIRWFKDAEFSAGNIIGMVTGSGSCTVSLPGNPGLTVREKDSVDAGDPLIEDLAAGSSEDETERIIEVMPDIGTEEDKI